MTPGRTPALFCTAVVCLIAAHPVSARQRKAPSPPPKTSSLHATPKTGNRQDDSFVLRPAKDLLLKIEGEHKADALAHFVAGISLEESGEIDKALDEYRKVLNVDPGQSELASRVAELLARDEDFPQAIDVLKDAIKANPTSP